MIHDTEALVCVDIRYRQLMGLNKYGTTVAKNPLELREWLQHAYEETLDKAIYLRRAMQEIDSAIEREALEHVPLTPAQHKKRKEMMAAVATELESLFREQLKQYKEAGNDKKES